MSRASRAIVRGGLGDVGLVALVVLTPTPGLAGPSNGQRLLADKGCGGCRTLAGVPAATGLAGPSLTNVALRPIVANGLGGMPAFGALMTEDQLWTLVPLVRQAQES